MEENRTKGYLYSMKKLGLSVREGYVVPNPWWPGHRRGEFSGRFYIEGEKDKYVQCNIKPEVVYHDIVWLEERDDKLAEDLFVEHELAGIEKLKEKIHKHEQKIENIRKGIS